MVRASSSRSVQVLIIGAGPVGSLAAYQLAHAGIDVALFDDHAVPVLDYRASTFQPPTLDLLEPFGVTDALVRMGLPSPVIQYRDRREGPIGEIDLSVLSADTAYPYRLQCEQFKLTSWLQQRIAESPHANLLFGSPVVRFAADESGTTVELAGQEGSVWHGRYAIAADGARSTVRRAIGIEFEGYTHPEQFLVAGTSYDFASTMEDIRSVNYTSDPDEWFLLLRIPDMWRVVVPVPQAVASDEAMSSDYIQRCLQNISPSGGPFEILVSAIHRVHQRVASTYRRGSTFLAGDAAHVNNPLGGMGLNGGIHDALLLTDGLARVLHGEDESLLDGYEVRRRAVAIDDINASTERNKRLLEERDPLVRATNNRRLRQICSDPQAAHQHALDISMISSLRRIGTLRTPSA
jgi:3-(3-hydroxy-phenyl)propionate hydroxylase